MTAVGHGAWQKLRREAQPLDERKLIALSPILVVAPHQDDETLGCGGLLAMASRLGLRPRVAYLTDGSASHLGSATWPPARLARTRRQEALSALEVLGVGSHDVHFLGWPDAAPLAPGQRAYGRSLDRLADWAAAFAPASLWSPWRGERHCDHVAAADLVLDLSRRLNPRPMRMDYLVWGWTEACLARAAGAAWALDCPDTTEVRERALACHRTQLDGLIVDARTSFQIPPELAALTGRPTEIYLEGA